MPAPSRPALVFAFAKAQPKAKPRKTKTPGAVESPGNMKKPHLEYTPRFKEVSKDEAVREWAKASKASPAPVPAPAPAPAPPRAPNPALTSASSPSSEAPSKQPAKSDCMHLPAPAANAPALTAASSAPAGSRAPAVGPRAVDPARLAPKGSEVVRDHPDLKVAPKACSPPSKASVHVHSPSSQAEAIARAAADARTLIRIQNHLNVQQAYPLSSKDQALLGNLISGKSELHAAVWTFSPHFLEETEIGKHAVYEVDIRRRAIEADIRRARQHGLVSAGEDVWRVTVMIQRQTFDSGVIRIGDWDFPCQLGWAGRSRVCKIHRMLGENWTQTTAEELQAMLEERLGLI